MSDKNLIVKALDKAADALSREKSLEAENAELRKDNEALKQALFQTDRAQAAAAPASTQAQPAAQPKTETKAQTATEALLAAHGCKTLTELKAKAPGSKGRKLTGLGS